MHQDLTISSGTLIIITSPSFALTIKWQEKKTEAATERQKRKITANVFHIQLREDLTCTGTTVFRPSMPGSRCNTVVSYFAMLLFFLPFKKFVPEICPPLALQFIYGKKKGETPMLPVCGWFQKGKNTTCLQTPMLCCYKSLHARLHKK